MKRSWLCADFRYGARSHLHRLEVTWYWVDWKASIHPATAFLIARPSNQLIRLGLCCWSRHYVKPPPCARSMVEWNLCNLEIPCNQSWNHYNLQLHINFFHLRNQFSSRRRWGVELSVRCRTKDSVIFLKSDTLQYAVILRIQVTYTREKWTDRLLMIWSLKFIKMGLGVPTSCRICQDRILDFKIVFAIGATTIRN